MIDSQDMTTILLVKVSKDLDDTLTLILNTKSFQVVGVFIYLKNMNCIRIKTKCSNQ